MIQYKKFNNGLRLVVNKMEGSFSVSCGVMVKTGSANESESENGISHFIEHTVFKGTSKRSSFEISDYIDSIGAQINAYTSKETTCFYTKSTDDHFEDCLEVLSDIFFNSTFSESELQKEKGVIIEEINMNEDSPEDICFDLLSESEYGKSGLGQTILGPIKNIKRFTRQDVLNYMDKYYTADNVVISIAGSVDIENAIKLVENYFANKFTRIKSSSQFISKLSQPISLNRYKDIEQTHIGIAMPTFDTKDGRKDALSIANFVLGGGMSSRLFQTIRENMGLCYNIYSYTSHYKDSGVLEIYAGVNTESRSKALDAIIKEIKNFKKGISKEEFNRGKEQIKSAFIFGQESNSSQMLLYGRYMLYFDDIFDYKKRIESISNITLDDVNSVIKDIFNVDKYALSTVGSKHTKLKI